MTSPIQYPELYNIGHTGSLTVASPPDDLDPRGLVVMLEPPSNRETYVMGVDPTVGIVGWHRQFRTRDDLRTDNGAIEIIKVGRDGKPDIQVCEYAAPIDPEDLADVCNVLGRLYGGNSDDGQCLCIIEVYPGPGLLTQRKMLNSLGYTNMFIWKYLDSIAVRMSTSLGWQSSPKSVRDLWIRGTRHITLDKVRVLSPYLAEELAHCETDELKMTAKASSGKHDDRVRAFLMAIWAAHDWSYQVDTVKTEVTTTKPVDWQRSDISAAKMYEEWSDRFAEMQEEQ
jgi:hypothetical protein